MLQHGANSMVVTGTIPPLGNFTVLRSFSVGVNQISGPLPPDWLSSKSIREFDAAYCRLTGTLPAVGVTPAGFDPQRFPYLGFGGAWHADAAGSVTLSSSVRGLAAAVRLLALNNCVAAGDLYSDFCKLPRPLKLLHVKHAAAGGRDTICDALLHMHPSA